MQNGQGLSFATLHDGRNGMALAMIIMAAQWPVLLLLAWYLGQVLPSGAQHQPAHRRYQQVRPVCLLRASAAHMGQHPAPGQGFGPVNEKAERRLLARREWRAKTPFILSGPVHAAPRLPRCSGLRRIG